MYLRLSQNAFLASQLAMVSELVLWSPTRYLLAIECLAVPQSVGGKWGLALRVVVVPRYGHVHSTMKAVPH